MYINGTMELISVLYSMAQKGSDQQKLLVPPCVCVWGGADMKLVNDKYKPKYLFEV